MFAAVNATAHERAVARAGDDIVSPADVVLDRAFTLQASPQAVWPWLVQLGKGRAGWYQPRAVERLIPARRRALREIDPQWQNLLVTDAIADYGGKNETFHVARIHPPEFLVYSSRRGKTTLTWSITLTPMAIGGGASGTRVLLRLRMAPVRWKRLANIGGEFIDALTVAGMAAGLTERLAQHRSP